MNKQKNKTKKAVNYEVSNAGLVADKQQGTVVIKIGKKVAGKLPWMIGLLFIQRLQVYFFQSLKLSNKRSNLSF